MPEIRIIFIGHLTAAANAIFNPNGFPGELQREVTICANRFALYLHNSSLLASAIEKDRSEFLSILSANANDLESACNSRPELRVVAYTDGLRHLMIFHSILYSLKSFLDVFAILVCRIINPRTSPTTFGSKKINGKEISGAKLARWVERSSPASFSKKLQLKDLVLSHSRDWISDAVGYRDTLAHFGEIKGMEVMSIPGHAAKPPFDTENIRLPKLPSGELLSDYCSELVTKLGIFLDAVIPCRRQ